MRAHTTAGTGAWGAGGSGPQGSFLAVVVTDAASESPSTRLFRVFNKEIQSKTFEHGRSRIISVENWTKQRRFVKRVPPTLQITLYFLRKFYSKRYHSIALEMRYTKSIGFTLITSSVWSQNNSVDVNKDGAHSHGFCQFAAGCFVWSSRSEKVICRAFYELSNALGVTDIASWCDFFSHWKRWQ